MNTLPVETLEAIAYHATDIHTYHELLQLRRLSCTFQMLFEKSIFDNLHRPTAYEGSRMPYTATGECSDFLSKVQLYEYAIHPYMLARMIVRYSHHWRNAKHLLSSQVQKTFEALRALRASQGLSIEGDVERDLLAITILSYGPSRVMEMLRTEADVRPELTNEDIQHALLGLFTHRNDVKEVRFVLESSTKPYQHSGIFGTTTHIAATNGYREMLQLLHSYGADVNGPAGGWRGNCLQTAALGGHAEVIHFLLRTDSGLDLERNDFKPKLLKYLKGNIRGELNNDLVAAIFCAMPTGNDIAVEALLKEVEYRRLPVSVHILYSILSIAMKTGRTPCTRAALYYMRYDTWTLEVALRKAVKSANHIQVSQILASSTLQAPEPDWTSFALQHAASFGLVEFLNIVLAHGDTISPRSAAHILCSALQAGHADIVHVLISRGTGLPYGENSSVPLTYFPDFREYRPLSRLKRVVNSQPLSAAACRKRNLEFFQKFIDNGTSLTYDNAGIWALNTAAWYGNAIAAETLLQTGVDAAAGMPSDPSWTPMKLAAANGRESIVQLFKRFGQEVPQIDAVQEWSRFTRRERVPRRLRKDRICSAI